MSQFTEDELLTLQASLREGGAFAARMLVQRELDAIRQNAMADQVVWNTWCNQFGLTPSDYGKVFTIKRSAYRAVSINPQAPKFPVNAVRLSDNKPFRVPARCVK